MFIRTLQFRAEVVIYSFLDVLPYFVLFFVWKAIFKQVDTLNSFTLSEIVNYYLLVIVIERLSATHFESWRTEEIRMGKIDYFLTRPFSYLSEIYSKEVSSKLISILFSIPVISIFFIANVIIYNIDQSNITLQSLLIFLLMMLAAHTIQFFIALWIVLLGFWMEGSSGLEHFKWIVLTLFSGAMIPIEFMPNWLKTITNVLPFKYVFSVPITVLQNKYALGLYDYVYVAFILFGMAYISKVLWEKAKFKYCSAGG
ncbi:MAG: ABC transporter permease [Patescibacteria group bacterium]|nr:MAG: ABC transporter permease [Patescibacteria group bacterium]